MKVKSSYVLIALPANAGLTTVIVEGKNASLLIRVPPEVAAFIHSGKAETITGIDTNRFPIIEQGVGFRSTNYETAANRVDIQVDVALGSVEIESG